VAAHASFASGFAAALYLAAAIAAVIALAVRLLSARASRAAVGPVGGHNAQAGS
jgi:hypothetical protein